MQLYLLVLSLMGLELVRQMQLYLEVLATLPGLTPGTRDAQLYMQLFLLVLALMGLECGV
jgi:hypothetical protein